MLTIHRKCYFLFQGIEKLSKKYGVSEQKKGLLDETYYTEGEMLATMLDLAEEGTFFDCSSLDCIPYVFTMRCDDYFVDGKLDTEKFKEDFYKNRGA